MTIEKMEEFVDEMKKCGRTNLSCLSESEDPLMMAWARFKIDGEILDKILEKEKGR